MARLFASNEASQPCAPLPFRRCRGGAGARRFTYPLRATQKVETKRKVVARNGKGDESVSEANQVVSGRGVRVEVSSFIRSWSSQKRCIFLAPE